MRTVFPKEDGKCAKAAFFLHCCGEKASIAYTVLNNIIERAFREVRRRTDMVRRLLNETAALTLIWARFEEDRLK